MLCTVELLNKGLAKGVASSLPRGRYANARQLRDEKYLFAVLNHKR